MRKFTIATITALSLCSAFGAETLDSQMSTLAQTLAAKIKDSGRKKVTVLEFTDLEGKKITQFGRYIAEQLTVNLDSSKKEFAIVDRANLKRILDEHKLTVSGLIDPKTAKEFGQISGVDALILGTVADLPNSVKVFAKIIATDTAVVAGSGECRVTKDDEVKYLLGRGIESGGGANIDNGNVDPKSEGPKTGDSATRTKEKGPCSEANTGNYGFTNTKKVTVFTVIVYYREGADSSRTITVPPGQTQYVYDFPAGRHNYMVTYRAQVPIMAFPPGAPTTEKDVAYLRGEINVEQCKSGILEIK